MTSEAAGDRTGDGDIEGTGYAASKASRFRFKAKRKCHHDRDDDLVPAHRGKRSRSSSPRGASRHRHHRSRRPRDRVRSPPPTPPDDPTLYDSTYLPNARSANYLDPDTAFRESLFDALADDEGAAFWEGVYGQPIHTYADVRPGPEGELERMTEEEYTAFVRARMYEKTHQHIVEERARREEQKERRAKAKAESTAAAADSSAFDRDIDASLRRGQERRRRARWRERWAAYVAEWKGLNEDHLDLEAGSTREARRRTVRSRIPWPVESGRFSDLEKAAIESFFRTAASATDADLPSVLKAERVRWHPDKMQQRVGGQDGLDDSTMKAVTAVFQVVDRMWGEERAKAE